MTTQPLFHTAKSLGRELSWFIQTAVTWLINNWLCFSVPEAGKFMINAWTDYVWCEPTSSFISDCLLTLSSHGQSTEREANCLLTSLRSSNHEGSIFMTSCNSNYLINVPPLNIIILGIRFQNVNFGGTLTFQSRVQVMIAPLEGHSLIPLLW